MLKTVIYSVSHHAHVLLLTWNIGLKTKKITVKYLIDIHQENSADKMLQELEWNQAKRVN